MSNMSNFLERLKLANNNFISEYSNVGASIRYGLKNGKIKNSLNRLPNIYQFDFYKLDKDNDLYDSAILLYGKNNFSHEYTVYKELGADNYLEGFYLNEENIKRNYKKEYGSGVNLLSNIGIIHKGIKNMVDTLGINMRPIISSNTLCGFVDYIDSIIDKDKKSNLIHIIYNEELNKFYISYNFKRSGNSNIFYERIELENTNYECEFKLHGSQEGLDRYDIPSIIDNFYYLDKGESKFIIKYEMDEIDILGDRHYICRKFPLFSYSCGEEIERVDINNGYNHLYEFVILYEAEDLVDELKDNNISSIRLVINLLKGLRDKIEDIKYDNKLYFESDYIDEKLEKEILFSRVK